MYKLWSGEEIKLLRDCYSTSQKEELLEILPNKTASAISHKAQRLGLSKAVRWWSEKELEILRDCWPRKVKPELLEALPNKHWTSIRHKAFELGLKKERHSLRYWRTYWDEKELDTLKDDWSKKVKPELLKALPNKHWTSIRHKAFELGLKKEQRHTRYWHTYWKVPKIELTDRQIGYFAGIIDADGHLRIMRSRQKTRDYYAPFIGITNTSMILIQKCMDIFKCGHFYSEEYSNPNHKTKLVYNTATVKGVKQILTQIVDELTVKKERAKTVLEFIKIKEEKIGYGTDPREIELFEKMRRLNARGSGVKF